MFFFYLKMIYYQLKTFTANFIWPEIRLAVRWKLNFIFSCGYILKSFFIKVVLLV